MDETDQFEDNRTKVLASRSANSTMMKGFVLFFFFFAAYHYYCTSINERKRFFFKKKNRIVELRRPIDTSLLGRIHSITETFVEGRTTTTTTTTTANYRDNPNSDGAVDLTLSRMNDAPSSRRLR